MNDAHTRAFCVIFSRKFRENMTSKYPGDELMLKSTFLNTGSSIVYFFAQWITTVLAVRLANFETAGIFAMAISYTNLFYFLALFGIRNYQISDVEKRFSDGQYLAARIVTMALAAVGFLVVSLVKDLPEYTFFCYGVYMLFKLGEAYTEGYFPLLQLREDYVTLAVSYTAKGLISTAAFALSLYMTADLLTATIWMTASYGLCVLALDIPQLVKMGLERPVFSGCWEILRNCVPLMLVSLSTPVMNYMTRFAIEQELNNHLLGQYASLSSVIVVMSTFAGAVFVVFVPKVSSWKEQQQWQLIRKFFGYAFIGMVFAGILAMLAGKILGPFVCALIFGEEILESIALLVPLLATSSVLMVKSFFSVMLIPLNQRWRLFSGECSGAILCAAAAIPLTRLMGMQGTNLSYLLGTLLQATILGGCVIRTVTAAEKKKEGRNDT